MFKINYEWDFTLNYDSIGLKIEFNRFNFLYSFVSFRFLNLYYFSPVLVNFIIDFVIITFMGY